MSKQILPIVLIVSFALGGCTTLNQAAAKLKLDFWNTKVTKAPCKLQASNSEEFNCTGVPIQKPNEDEILKLRGRYIVENGVIKSSNSFLP